MGRREGDSTAREVSVVFIWIYSRRKSFGINKIHFFKRHNATFNATPTEVEK